MAKTVGNLNGPWAMLFKFFLVMFPMLAGIQIMFGAWVVQQVMEFEHRLTVIETTLAQIP